MVITHWVEWVESENDFLIEASDIPHIDVVDDIIYEYSQAKHFVTKNSCTIFGSTWAVSDLMNYKYSYDELLQINKDSYDKGRIKGRWWRVFMAVDLVRDDWNNKNETNKVLSFRTSIDSTMVDALNKWHSLVTSYKGSPAYGKDFKDNGKLDKVTFWTPTYWHCVRIRKIDGLVYVIDNYHPRRYNKYELVDFRELVKNGVFSQFQYLFLPEKSIEKTKEELKLISFLKKLKKINSATYDMIEKVGGYEWVKKELHALNNEIRSSTK